MLVEMENVMKIIILNLFYGVLSIIFVKRKLRRDGH